MILVIDDEPLIRDTVRDILEMEGHQVSTAANGLLGLEIYQSNPDDVGLIFLDLTMPVMDGRETVTRLQQINPDVNVIISSGYYETALEIKTRSNMRFLPKPFDMGMLLHQVNMALSA